MNVQYLDCDELAIESEVRGISGTVAVKMTKLQVVLQKEFTKEINPPVRAHSAALKSPKREIKLCSNKLKMIENQLTEVTEGSGFDDERIAELTTTVLHVGDRLARINSAKSVTTIATKLISACEKLLNCLKDIEAEKAVSTVVENSLKQVFGDIPEPGDQEVVESESGEEITDFNKDVDHLAGPSQSSVHPAPNLPKPNSELTEDDRVDLIVDRLYRKLSLSDIPLPPNKPWNNNMEFPMNLNPKQQPPLDKLVPDQPKANLMSSGSKGRIPKQYLEIYNWKMTYHGDEKDELPVERFLYRVQRMAEENELNKRSLAANLSVLLKGQALNWYWEFQETYGSVEWEVLSEAMVQRFKTRRTDFDVRQALERRKQRVKENFLEFYHAIRSLTLSLMQPMSDFELINLITRNMRGGLQAKFAGNQFSSISEMVNQCVTVEDTWSRLGWIPEIYHQQRSRQVNELDVVGNDEENAAQGYKHSEQHQYSDSVCALSASKDFAGTYKQQKPMSEKSYSTNSCWNCSSVTHFFKDCVIPVKHRFCFGCGAPNTLKSQCRNCKDKPKGNAMRDFRATGSLNSQAYTPRTPRYLQEEAATNTDPELHQGSNISSRRD